MSQFFKDPHHKNGSALNHLDGCLHRTRDDGFILGLKVFKSFELYADADFCGNWNMLIVSDDPYTTKSWSEYIILYAGFPILCDSKLQIVIALSSAEVNYVYLCH